MLVGLGTGSTAAHLVRELGRRLRAGELSGVRGVADVAGHRALAREVGSP
jgi:ribose 5-phosphate isomerase A